jgi:hypothetical protein
MGLFLEAASRRTQAATALNAQSSRSHALAFFNVYARTAQAASAAAGSSAAGAPAAPAPATTSLLNVINARTGAIESGYSPRSSLCLVDLAGSERLARTGNTGALLGQANNINMSLSHIMRCFTAMVEQQGGGRRGRRRRRRGRRRGGRAAGLSLPRVQAHAPAVGQAAGALGGAVRHGGVRGAGRRRLWRDGSGAAVRGAGEEDCDAGRPRGGARSRGGSRQRQLL